MPILRLKLPNRPGVMTHVLDGARITIGRGADNTIQIMDRTVSVHHAELIAVQGHYRLHDLGSTNLTCVAGQPVTDYHLLEPCQVLFGTIEAEFSPETPNERAGVDTEWVATRAEFEFLKREKLDLQKQVAALQKQVAILGSAPLMTNESTLLSVPPDVHRRVEKERDELRQENATLKLEAENLHCDIVAIVRDRDALRQAWATVKAELVTAERELEHLRRSAPPEVPIEPEDEVPTLSEATGANSSADPHRVLAQLLAKGPGTIECLRRDLKLLSASPGDNATRLDAVRQTKALVACACQVDGHPIQRLAVGVDALLSDIGERPGIFDVEALATLKEAVNLLSAILNPQAFRFASTLPPPRVLALDHDRDLLATVVAALEIADIQTVSIGHPADALAELRSSEFDLVFIDSALPGIDGLDLCTEIRALPGYRRVPILFLTTADTIEGRTQAFLDGGTDFLCKPFNVLELTLKTQTWIYRHQFGLLPRGVNAEETAVPCSEISLESLQHFP